MAFMKIKAYAGIGDLNPYWNSNLLWGDFYEQLRSGLRSRPRR